MFYATPDGQKNPVRACGAGPAVATCCAQMHLASVYLASVRDP